MYIIIERLTLQPEILNLTKSVKVTRNYKKDSEKTDIWLKLHTAFSY